MSLRRIIKLTIFYLLIVLSLGFIALSTIAVEEGTHDGLLVAEFLAKYFYIVAIPIYKLGSVFAEHTNWINTTYWIVSLLLISAAYLAVIIGLTEIIWNIMKKSES